MSRLLKLPGGDVTLDAGPLPETGKKWNRTAYAAAHVVVDPLAEFDPWLDAPVDWDRTLAFREHVWSLGFGVAEAMDTAQRGMGLDWATSLELIQRSTALAKAGGHLIASGAGTDHLEPSDDVTIDDVIRAYEEQCEAVEATGSRVILMASRALVKAARSPDDYARVYGRVLFMYTGDDFNYPRLIEGDEHGYSHALLGIFDPIAGAAARALSHLAEGDMEAYNSTFAPTVPLSRHIFKAPTRFYKTGVVFLAYLNGHQDHFTMIAGQESTRSTRHLADIVRMANDAQLFTDPDEAAARVRSVFAVRGVVV